MEGARTCLDKIPALHCEHKTALAENFFADVLPMVRLRRDQILKGDRTYLDRMTSLLDYE